MKYNHELRAISAQTADALAFVSYVRTEPFDTTRHDSLAEYVRTKTEQVVKVI